MERGGLLIPPRLARSAVSSGWGAFLQQLPGFVAEAGDLFGVDVMAPFLPGGTTSFVAPVRTEGGGEAVLKITWPHPEAADEAKGLSCWAGEGAVLLQGEARLEGGWLLLIERCRPGRELGERPEEEQDAVLAGLLRRLWSAPTAGHFFRPLSEMCDRWADEYERRPAPAGARLDAGLAREGIALLRHLPRQERETVLLATDLHAGNVLSAGREPWLMIDPKPYLGDPAYDLTQHLFNCLPRLLAAPAPTIGRLSSLAGVDPARVRLWCFARAVEASPQWAGMAELARLLSPSVS